jgi:glycosyltransferase involved in cell wall biosynthesis
MDIVWISTPPSKGSGGHTTMFRVVGALEERGHRCRIYVDDPHGWDIAQHQRTVATCWPWVKAEVRDLGDGVEDAHVLFATSWETAYPALVSPAAGSRCYFVQDFEPSFYPAGSEALLAEATYRFGFHGITAGRWLAQHLKERYGMAADHFDFGCDLERYRIERSPQRRNGVCYFSRPSTPRRAHQLAVLALEELARRDPGVEIHIYGEDPGPLAFDATIHGLLSPDELGALYNRCVAGFVISATNVSLVPHEMLAAGCIPVVNDAEHNRIVLDNDFVAYSPPTPFDLAETLFGLLAVDHDGVAARAEEAAHSVESVSWEKSGGQVEQALLRLLDEANPSGNGSGLGAPALAGGRG